MKRKSPELVRLRNIAAGYAGSKAKVSVSDADYKLLCGYAESKAKGVETVANGRAHYLPAAEFVKLVDEASTKPDAPPKQQTAPKKAEPKKQTASKKAEPKK